ncbi:lipid II:glycine glycyltransferase FemX [Thermoflavimicrobium dichotomicum]|uniref:Lipid II:glycine glycyltransferase n=1 Tax=Thermoflavimicrobium dichotomicum TaxID=46223 RepID=A0A1I3R7Z3_9BACL|nr:peptidoglycan bridge formation glycyltransferase FemA/FemB family protein [Thermoflavimicrobium dichotomicum]SFJ42754.1 Lipid II:glycine glycyltransferase (Peptidoglycan interpeptide bridge formation enzyme) [Thermoflavimicrobium dichotomicum]
MLKVALVNRKRYLNFIEDQPFRNFLQYPSWADLKTEWQWSSELLGWFTQDNQMVGCALVLYRKVPGLNKFLAYIPRGPMIDWFSDIPLEQWFAPLFEHFKQLNVFSVKMDPPLVRRKWYSETIMESVKDFESHGLQDKKITDIRPDKIFNEVEKIQQELGKIGWKQNVGEDSFDTVQPQFVFRLNLQGKTIDQIFAEFHPHWQKKINQAEWEGVEVTLGNEQDIPDFYQLLVETAKLEGSQVRDISYFEKMYETLTTEDPQRLRLYLAKQGGQLLSAALAIHVDGHTWDLYSAKYMKSDPAASYLLRWKMIQDAYVLGDHTFDFRGISTTLNEKDPYYDLLRFKVGFNGEACEFMGEWDYPLIPMLHWAFYMYMKRRG